MRADILVPEDLQRHMLALQLAVNMRPIRFNAATVTGLRAGSFIESRFQHRISDIVAQRPGKLGTLQTAQSLAHRLGGRTNTHRNRLWPRPSSNLYLRISRTRRIFSLSAGTLSFLSAHLKGRTSHQRDTPTNSPIRGRHHLGTRGGYFSELGATSFRNAGVDCLGICIPGI